MIKEVGELVVFQEVWRDRVWAARPMLVAHDDGELVALWFPKGTPYKGPTTPPNRPRAAARAEHLVTCLELGDWVYEDRAWDVSTLVLMRTGDWHALWVSWRDGWKRMSWYVNLQEPFRRTRTGLETMDLALDVVIDHDCSWRWKDEDELELFVSRGVLDSSLAERVRNEGLRVVRLAERRGSAFGEPWSEWRPPPSWGMPELPSGWDELCR